MESKKKNKVNPNKQKKKKANNSDDDDLRGGRRQQRQPEPSEVVQASTKKKISTAPNLSTSSLVSHEPLSKDAFLAESEKLNHAARISKAALLGRDQRGQTELVKLVQNLRSVSQLDIRRLKDPNKISLIFSYLFLIFSSASGSERSFHSSR